MTHNQALFRENIECLLLGGRIVPIKCDALNMGAYRDKEPFDFALNQERFMASLRIPLTCVVYQMDYLLEKVLCLFS
ncbi:MAG: hypothetical protein KKG95_04945, partial [Candidatus Omnitrophica bacterium]|nr:hypothetical protein [Candidatus Omnitrophota bacterium]